MLRAGLLVLHACHFSFSSFSSQAWSAWVLIHLICLPMGKHCPHCPTGSMTTGCSSFLLVAFGLAVDVVQGAQVLPYMPESSDLIHCCQRAGGAGVGSEVLHQRSCCKLFLLLLFSKLLYDYHGGMKSCCRSPSCSSTSDHITKRAVVPKGLLILF